MGHHRADRRGLRRFSTSRDNATRRVAGHTEEQTAVTSRVTTPADVAAPVRVDLTHHVNDLESTAALPLLAADPPGKRKAVKHADSRGPLYKTLPTAPVAVGITIIAVAVGGAVASPEPVPKLTASAAPKVSQTSALNGLGGIASADGNVSRQTPVSRGSQRGTLEEVSDSKLVAAVAKQSRQRDAALGQLAQQADQQAEKLAEQADQQAERIAQQADQQAERIAENTWVYPLEPVVLTARFGEYGLWSSSHTGLDFNGETGDPVKAIAGGVVTSAGYDGAYGNKTVVTLDDGTEIWYAHQTSYTASPGETVRAGDVIGSVGSTGNVTGSHLHVEVRPGGGDSVDPFAAMQVNGLF